MSAGMLLTLGTKVIELTQNYSKLGKEGKKVASDAQSMSEQIFALKDKLRELRHRLPFDLRQRLGRACEQCQNAVTAADETAKELNSRAKRAVAAVLSPEKAVEVRGTLLNHRAELLSITGDISIHFLSQLIENSDMTLDKIEALQPRRAPVRANVIPTNTPEFTRRLLERGEYVDTPCPDGHTSLCNSCESDENLALTKLLLRQGANLGKGTPNTSNSAIHIAAHKDATQTLRAIKAHVVGPPPGSQVPADSNDDLRKRSARKREQAQNKKWVGLLQASNKDGRTPLHQAAAGRALGTLSFLLNEKGCKKVVDAKDKWDNTALHIAATRGDVESVKKLLAVGVKTKELDGGGRTPLQLAEEGKHDACVSALKEAKQKRKMEVKGKGTKPGVARRQRAGMATRRTRDRKGGGIVVRTKAKT